MNQLTAIPAGEPVETADNLRFLRRTFVLARRGRGRTSPNPMVGAVVVRDGEIIGEGFHPGAGQPHAEVFALRAAGERARGATLYVSLEPCSHYGRTPPCADAIITAGIRRVVVAAEDPNPLVAGRGLEKLRAAGIAVECGTLRAEEEQLNEAYRHWIVTRRPFVTLKLAASLDGKLATRTGDARWITGDASRRDAHRLRAASDAVLTTAATVLADDPALTARLRGARQPRRVVVDARLRVSPEARVYAPGVPPPLLATIVDNPARLAPFRARGIEVLVLPACAGHVDLPALLAALGERDIVSLMVESGGLFASALLEASCVQKIRIYLAPLLIGGEKAVPALGGLGAALLAGAPRLRDVTWKRLGEDFRVEGYLNY